MAAPHTAIRTAASVRETSTTTGTGTFSLGGAVAGFQTFVAGVGNAAVVPYFARLRNGSEWEYGIGTVTDATPDTLARTTVLRGTSGTSAVNFSAGIKDIWCGPHPAHFGVHVAGGAPAVTDDNDGPSGTFLPGSLWLDSTADVLYVCVDDTGGAAVWRPIGGKVPNIGASSELTLSSGAVTVTGGAHSIDTEGNAAEDVLTTIDGGVASSVIALTPESSTRRVHLEEGDNILLAGPSRVTLIPNTRTLLFNNGVNWVPFRAQAIESFAPNLLLNGNFAEWYRQTTSATAATDDAYFAPKWYALIQGSGPTAAQTSGLSRNGATTACKLVAGGTTNRFGVAQIVEARLSHTLRGQVVTLQATVRPNLNAGSGNMDIRIALLEWTGAADSVTSEVVNSWTNGTFTTGQFFTSTTLTLVGTAMVEVDHNTWHTISITGTVSSSCNNLIALVWTEDAPANAADFLEITEASLYRGWSQQEWHEHPNERALCERFLYRVAPTSIGTLVYNGVKFSSTILLCEIHFPTMRANPTLVHTIASYNNAAAATATQMDVFNFATGAVVQITGSLMLALLVDAQNTGVITATAGTSWNGTNGTYLRFRFGVDTTDYILLNAEL